MHFIVKNNRGSEGEEGLLERECLKIELKIYYNIIQLHDNILIISIVCIDRYKRSCP